MQGHYLVNQMLQVRDTSQKNFVRKRSLSPTISSANRENNNLVCIRVQNQTVKPEVVSKNFKPRRQGYETTYPKKVDRKVYFNPFNKGEEVFVKRDDIPELEPMWADDKGEARQKVYSFLNEQNLRMVQEMEPHTYQKLVTELARISTTLVNEINEHNPL